MNERGDRRSIDEILAAARARLDRVAPEDLERERLDGAVIVDIRPVEQRTRDGELPGAIVIDRNVLEWRLDPSCEHHIADITGHDTRIVLVCNEGYSSSLAAALLHDLGLSRATDLVDGYQGWLDRLGGRRQPPATASPTVASTPHESPHRRSPMDTAATRYLAPDWFTRKAFNPAVAGLTKLGLSVKGSRVLTVRGRTSGEPRSTVVNLLTVDGVRYLVAPRGATQWVRNVRAAGSGTLRVGRRVETFTATELDDAAKAPIIRAYLKAWAWEVGKFFDGLKADSSDAEIAAVAAGFPIFRLR